MSYSGMNAGDFAEALDVQRSSLSHIASGRNKPSLDFLVKVKARFPELEWNWLITGEGEMLNSGKAGEKAQLLRQPSPAPLSELFDHIQSDKFGMENGEDNIHEDIPRELPGRSAMLSGNHTEDSHRLAPGKTETPAGVSVNKNNSIKRIIIFFENGKFESYEP